MWLISNLLRLDLALAFSEQTTAAFNYNQTLLGLSQR